jgi:hypothetical protein
MVLLGSIEPPVPVVQLRTPGTVWARMSATTSQL